MSNYTKTTNFTAKDALPTSDPNKIISGVDFDTEFDNIQTANNTKVDTAGTALGKTGTTLNLDINGLAALTAAGADELAVADADGSYTPKKLTLTELSTWLETDMQHDNLTGFVADEHVAHGSVTLTAGNGLSGGGTIAASRTFTLDLNELGVETTMATGDYVAMVDVTDNGSQKITLANFALAIDSVLNHDSLGGFVGNEHIDHSTVSVTAGTGLTGGGTIASTRTINLDTSTLTTRTPISTDTVPFYDVGVGMGKCTVATLVAGGVGDASESAKGIIEIATAAEAKAGSSNVLALTPGRFAGNKSLAEDGYYVFPGGFTIQWGKDLNTAVGGTITFPTAFTTLYAITVTPISSAVVGGEDTHAVYSETTTNFRIDHNDYPSGVDFYWMATGYKA